jgi:hypothetical protein
MASSNATTSKFNKGKSKNKMSREDRSLMYKSFIGNKSEGQGFADKRKRQIVYQYKKIESKEKQALNSWSDKLEKLYNDVSDSSDEDEIRNKRIKKLKRARNDQTTKQQNSRIAPEQLAKLKVSAFHREEKEWQRKKYEKEQKQKEAEERERTKIGAQARYHKEKQRKHKLLAKKNYKGQPNMASRMMLLLEKIEKTNKS